MKIETMSSDLSTTVANLIQQEFSFGRYKSQDELLVEAVTLLGQRDRLREQVDAGFSQFNSGQYTEYDAASLRQRFEQLKTGETFRASRDN